MISPHEHQDRRPEPSLPVRCRQCLIDFLPVTALVVLVVGGLILWLLVGCAERREAGYGSRDDVRAACASAAHAYLLAVERTRAGEMAPATFRGIDDGYAGVLTVCRRVLEGQAPPMDHDFARVQMWTASTEGSLP